MEEAKLWALSGCTHQIMSTIYDIPSSVAVQLFSLTVYFLGGTHDDILVTLEIG